jgi:DNA-binding transcriptional ArsR family regulator
LADPTRRQILQALRRSGPAPVSTVAAQFDISLPGVLKHLSVLERAGLLATAKQGRKRFLTLTPSPLNEAADWIDQYRIFWEQSLQALDDYIRQEGARDDHYDRS